MTARTQLFRRPLGTTPMRAVTRGAAVLLGALLAAPQALPQTRELGSSGELLDGIAAVVDDGVVLKSELEQRLELVMQSLREQQAQLPPAQRRPLPPLSALERQVLDQLILREVQLQRAKRLGITVSDDQLNQALSNVARNLGLTLEELPAALAAEGIDYALYREDSRQELILDQLQQRDVISRISVTPRELEQCLARREVTAAEELDYNISHILISVPSAATSEQIEAARRRIEEIYERLEAGEDFARLAVATSDAQTALEGGNLGWRKGSQLPTVFADIVPRMEVGEFSEPIRSSSGFQIVKLNDRRGGEPIVVEQLHVRHILIEPNEILDRDAAKQKIIGIREQILNGEDFATLARAQSEDTVSAADGGDLGWVTPDDFVPEFGQVLRRLDIGELSEPFETRFGWHIVEVLDRRSYDTTDEVKRQECTRQIRASKAEEELQLWITRLRDQAYVDIKI
ncbi:MAG TPA: peptidylprolyl isomerase [Gammaproteobacteria bacterium]